MVQLSLFCALKGTLKGKVFRSTDSFVIQANISDLKRELGFHGSVDAVVAASALGLDFSNEERKRLVSKLDSCFPDLDIFVNDRMYIQRPPSIPHCVSVADPVRVLLVQWVRLHCRVHTLVDSNVGRSDPEVYIHSLQQLSSELPNSVSNDWIQLASILSPDVFIALLTHFNEGLMFGNHSKVILKCFAIPIHAFSFLVHQKIITDQHEADVLFKQYILNFNSGIFDMCNDPQLEQPVANSGLKRKTLPSVEIVLRDAFRGWFQEWAHHFIYLIVTVVVGSEKKEYFLKAESQTMWVSCCKRHKLSWNGNRWALFIDNQEVGNKVVSRFLCISCLSCIQGTGTWGSTMGYDISVQICSQKEFDISNQHVPASGDVISQIVSKTSSPAPASDISSSHSSKIVSKSKRIRLSMSNDVFSNLSFFFGWDPILNVLEAPSSYEHDDLERLLERCLWTWGIRNNEDDKFQAFYCSALESLKAYAGRGSVPDDQWKEVFRTYGCFQTPPLFSKHERAMMMIACAWPAHHWTNIDQKQADDANFRVRGMSFLHPRFSKFLRSTLLTNGFINEIDFPSKYADYSFVSICSNVCRNSLADWKWRKHFVFDWSSPCLFLQLSQCETGLNANGVYAATTTQLDDMTVFAFANSHLHTLLSRSGRFVNLKTFPDLQLEHPTVILVRTSTIQEPVVHCVKFAFALNLNEHLICRDEVGSYHRFFSVVHNSENFIYVPTNPPIVSPIKVDFIYNQVSGSYPVVQFNFGFDVESLHLKLDLARSNRSLASLADQSPHLDGPPPHSQFWHDDIVKNGSQIFGVAPKIRKNRPTPTIHQHDFLKVSISSMFAVYPNTFIGVKLSRAKWIRIRIVDGGCFLFSFWLEHFGIGLSDFLWHFRVHGYLHSVDIRHFPVHTPEQFFVLFAAVKLAKTLSDSSPSLAGLENIILQSLTTHKDSASTHQSFFQSLDAVAVEHESKRFYSMLSCEQISAMCAPAVSETSTIARSSPIVSSTLKVDSMCDSRACFTDRRRRFENVTPPLLRHGVSLAANHGSEIPALVEVDDMYQVAASEDAFNLISRIGLCPDVTSDDVAQLIALFNVENCPQDIALSTGSIPCLVAIIEKSERFSSTVQLGALTALRKIVQDHTFNQAASMCAVPVLLKLFKYVQSKSHDKRTQSDLDIETQAIEIISIICSAVSAYQVFLMSLPHFFRLPLCVDLLPSNIVAPSLDGFRDLSTFIGIINHGSICPIISLVQSWFHCDPIRISVMLSPHDGPGILALKNVFRRLQSEEQPFIPEELVNVLFPPTASISDDASITFGSGQHEDVHEIFLMFLDLILDPTIDALLFMGMLKRRNAYFNTKVDSQQPATIIEVLEPFHCLEAPLLSCKSVDEVIASFCTTEDNLEYNFRDKDNSPLIQACDKLSSYQCFSSFPAVLHVSLKRFSFVNGQYSKIWDRMEFADILVVTENSKEIRYKLHSVLVHMEMGKHSVEYLGHYYAYVKCFGDQWMLFDDSTVRKASAKDAIDGNFGGLKYSNGRFIRHQPTAYMLIYLLATEDPVSSSPHHEVHSVPDFQVAPPIFTAPTHFKFANVVQISHENACTLIRHQNSADICSVLREDLMKHCQSSYDVHATALRYVYPEAFSSSDSSFNYINHTSPSIRNPTEFISAMTVNWFFCALATLFPDVMHLPSDILGFKDSLAFPSRPGSSFASWKHNFLKRRPRSVLHPLNLPQNTSFPTSSSNLSNPPFHWVFVGIESTFDSRVLKGLHVHVLDPLNHSISIDNVSDWYKMWLPIEFSSVSVTFVPYDASFCKLQSGHGNFNCAVYCMALGINYFMKSLGHMASLLVPPKYAEDTTLIGIELRKMVAWDCIRVPPLLDACLAMCPNFSVYNHGDSQLPECHPWWRITPHHDIAVALSIQPEMQSGGKFYIFGRRKNGDLKQNISCYLPVRGKCPSDGPFIFMNKTYVVKVFCIGLLNHFDDEKFAMQRAAFAFLESSATSFACTHSGDWHLTFGLICCGLMTPCACVCIARSKFLKLLSPCMDSLGEVFHNFTISTRMNLGRHMVYLLHNDGHSSNVMIDAVGNMHIIDFERSSLVKDLSLPQSLLFHQIYCSINQNPQPVRELIHLLMDQVRASGLSATHNHFVSLYSKNAFLSVAFNHDAFSESPVTAWRYCAWLHLMELIALHHPNSKPSLSFFNGEFIISFLVRMYFFTDDQALLECKIFFQSHDGAMSSLRCESESQIFVENFCKFEWHLKDDTTTKRFFQTALSVYDSDSCSSDSVDSPSTAPLPPSKAAKSLYVHPDSKSLQKLPNHSWLKAKMHAIGNPRALESIKTSMMRRFGSTGVLKDFHVIPKSEPSNVLVPIHFGCETVLVDDESTCARCIRFIECERFLSVDTEIPVPRHDHEGISIIQIGTTTIVFIIRVVPEAEVFVKQLGLTLNGKTLLCWGDDMSAIQRVTQCKCSFIDVQKLYSGLRQKAGLAQCTTDLFGNRFVLSKTWTLSGWDNPILSMEQLMYATLDVVALHALYALNQGVNIFESSGKHFTFHACDLSNLSHASKIKHGFSFSSQFIGHHFNGSISRGFNFRGSEPIPQGFTACQSAEVAYVDVGAFVNLLNDSKFCCVLCSGCSCEYLRKHWKFFALPSYSTFTVSKSAKAAALNFTVDEVSHNVDEQHAYYCGSMVAAFFRMRVSRGNLQSLNSSVCSDIHKGYICYTLSHLSL
jgi:hypothetical protein